MGQVGGAEGSLPVGCEVKSLSLPPGKGGECPALCLSTGRFKLSPRAGPGGGKPLSPSHYGGRVAVRSSALRRRFSLYGGGSRGDAPSHPCTFATGMMKSSKVLNACRVRGPPHGPPWQPMASAQAS